MVRKWGSTRQRVLEFASAVLAAGLLIGLVASARCESAAEYRRQADAAVRAGKYAEASDLYRKEAAVYRRLGDPNAAKVEEMKAERWSTEIEIFAESPGYSSASYPPAKHEPAYGCYLGAYLQMDDNLQGGVNSGDLERSFEKVIGRTISTSFIYCRWGQEFPSRWARTLLRQGIAPHIALEPDRGLEAVADDTYLRNFARGAGECQGPVFIRFGGEMNGDWTRWGQRPLAYKAKFRLVHDIMERHAPNAAMIWCVNQLPEHNVGDYYPGDEYVDWVGVNFYSVPFHDNDRNRPGLHECPASFIKSIYAAYSSRKPIAICEWGASHRASCDVSDMSPFAVEKIASMYSCLPRLFPRVKMINYFDCDNLTQARAGRKLNNYCVTDDPRVLKAFREAVSPSWFLAKYPGFSKTAAPLRIVRVSDGHQVSGRLKLSAWVKSYEPRPRVIYALDGMKYPAVETPGTYPLELDLGDIPAGKHSLSVTVLDSRGKVAGRKSVTITISRDGKTILARSRAHQRNGS